MLCFFTIFDIHGQEMSDTTNMSAAIHQLNAVEIKAVYSSTVNASSPFQVLKGDELQKINSLQVSDAVKFFSGVQVKDYGGVGGLKTMSIRGLGAQQTAVCYDGGMISDTQSGLVDIGRFSLNNVSLLSLEIIQPDDIFKPARAFASAGVLNINTHSPVFQTKKYNGKADLRVGSFGWFNPNLLYNQQINNTFSTSIFLDWQQAEGNYPFEQKNGILRETSRRDNSDIQSFRSEINLYGDFKKNGKMTFKSYSFQSERGLPGPVIFYAEPSGERLWDKNFFTQVDYNRLLGQKTSLKLFGKYNYAYNKYINPNSHTEEVQEDRCSQQEYSASGVIKYNMLSRFSLSVAEDIVFNTMENNFPDCPYPQRFSSLTSLAAQYKSPVLTVTGNLLMTYITEKVKNGNVPEDREKLSPALGFAYLPFKTMRLYVRGSYKNAYRYPTFNDLYYTRIGNTKLKPESAEQYNVGLTWSGSFFQQMDFLNVSTDFYYNKVNDKIVALPTLYLWRMMNMGKVEMKGVDLSLDTKINVRQKMNICFGGNYSFQYAVDVTDKTSKNYKHQIPYLPKHSGSAKISFENPYVDIFYTLMASGSRYAMPQNINLNRIEPYCEQSVSLRKTFLFDNNTLKVQVEMLNITDKKYEVIQYYPMPGRLYRLSAGFNF